MKLIVTQENLSKALQIVGRVAGSKTPLPILSNILFRTDKNRLLLAATNLEIAITQYVGSKIEEEGALTVPARLMSDFISNLPRGNVSLAVDGTKMIIKSGSYQSTINGMLPDEFPALPEITIIQEVTVTSSILKRALQQTALVASTDDTRPVLTGVYCHSYEGKLYLAGTDGYRLAERSLGPAKAAVSAIIPTQTLQDVLRVTTDEMSEIKMIFDENQVRFLMNDIEITSRLIDGAFPPYRQLIPAKSDIEVSIDKDEFTRLVKVASLFARESGGSITLMVNDKEQKLSISSVASQVGENTSEAAAKIAITGDLSEEKPGVVTLNSRYLLEALGCFDTPSVTFSFGGKLSPCVLTSNEKTTDYKHVIMPLKS